MGSLCGLPHFNLAAFVVLLEGLIAKDTFIKPE